jgi:hypothetical protein
MTQDGSKQTNKHDTVGTRTSMLALFWVFWVFAPSVGFERHCSQPSEYYSCDTRVTPRLVTPRRNNTACQINPPSVARLCTVDPDKNIVL